MKTTKHTVAEIIKLISVAYPKQVDATEEMVNLWYMLLKDIDAEVVMAATVEVCADGDRFPPPVGVIRQRALKFASGALSEKTGGDAWDRVSQWNRETPPYYGEAPSSIVLTEIERKALKSIGGSWALGHSTRPDFLRTQFIKRFDELQAASKAERIVMPETKELVESRQGATEFVKQLTEKMGE